MFVFFPTNNLQIVSQFLKNIISDIENSEIYIEDELQKIITTSVISFDKDNPLITANIVLKEAKRKNLKLLTYSEEIPTTEEYKENIKWTKKIKEAIANNRIVSVYQPIINNESGDWEKYESLMRMEEEDGKLVSPYFFLDISKKTKYYTELTKIMIKNTFEKIKEVEKEITINLTIEDILNEELKTYIFKMLEEYKLESKVVFEIEEGTVDSFDKLISFVEKVREFKAKIAIDNFGTGYSNFDYLIRLRPEYIKIDGSIIKNIENDPHARLIIAVIVTLAQKLGIKTMVIYVETEKIAEIIKGLKVDYSEGYFYSAPQKEIENK